MKKRDFFIFVILLLGMLALSACGKKETVGEEPVEAVDTVIEEEPRQEPEAEENATEESGDIGEESEKEVDEQGMMYAYLYLDQITSLHSDYKADQFALVDVDGDDMPELAVTSSSDFMNMYGEYYALYTIYDGDIKELAAVETSTDGTYIAYYEGKGVVETSGAALGERIYDSILRDGQLEEILHYESFGMPEEDSDDFVYHYLIDDEEVDENSYYDKIMKFREEYNRYTILEYDGLRTLTVDKDGEYHEDGVMPYRSYEEITADLIKVVDDGRKDINTEPWKEAYRNCLYEIYEGKVNIEGRSDGYTEDMVFAIYDLVGEEEPVLLVSYDHEGETPYWNVFGCDDDSYEHMGNMVYCDTESKEIYDYAWETFWISYFLCDLKEGKLVKTREIHYVDITDQPELAPDGIAYKRIDYDDKGNAERTEEISESDWNAFVTSYEDGLKKYGIKDYVHLSPKNIDIMLGFLNGDIDSGEVRSDDNVLYEVEVTAPDGYVNFRTGAGTEYDIITSISNGEVLSVISEENKWIQVEYNGQTGWVAESQVTRK